MAGDTYDADRISVVPEYQCRPHGGDYSMRGLGNLRIWREIDPISEKLIAFHTHMLAWDSERTIWMDGRPHPPDYAPHTWQGFSTGVWEGNMLTITTTHLKTNYMRRNGIPRSDKAIFTEHWTRHGDYLTVITVIEDPGVSDRASGAQRQLVSGSRPEHRHLRMRVCRPKCRGRKARCRIHLPGQESLPA